MYGLVNARRCTSTAVNASYLEILSQLLSDAAWSKHQAAIAADPDLQRGIAGVMLEHCLPATAAAVAEEQAPSGLPKDGHRCMGMLTAMASLVKHHSIAPGVGYWLQDDRAAAAVSHAAVILHAVSTAQPDGTPGNEWSRHLNNAATLVSALCQQVAEQHLAAQASVAAGGEQEAARALSCGETAAAAGWQVARVLPQLAASLAALSRVAPSHTAAPDDSPSGLGDLHDICLRLRWPLHLLLDKSLRQCSARQLSCWLNAVAASLRLLPCFGLLDARLRQHEGGSYDDRAAVLSDFLIRLLVAWLPDPLFECQAELCLPSGRVETLCSDDAAAWDSLPAQLWALHTGLSRLVAALTAAPGARSLTGAELTARQWRSLQYCIGFLTTLNADVHQLRW